MQQNLNQVKLYSSSSLSWAWPSSVPACWQILSNISQYSLTLSNIASKCLTLTTTAKFCIMLPDYCWISRFFSDIHKYFVILSHIVEWCVILSIHFINVYICLYCFNRELRGVSTVFFKWFYLLLRGVLNKFWREFQGYFVGWDLLSYASFQRLARKWLDNCYLSRL